MTYVQTAYLADTAEWVVRLVDVIEEGIVPFHLATRPDGSFLAYRRIDLHDFDENGWFRADVP